LLLEEPAHPEIQMRTGEGDPECLAAVAEWP